MRTITFAIAVASAIMGGATFAQAQAMNRDGGPSGAMRSEKSVMAPHFRNYHRGHRGWYRYYRY